MRKAKIVCTIGPASNSREIIRELIKNGMDVVRLNFSHGDHETHHKVVTVAQQEAFKQNKIISILQDLQGIKIRLSDVDGGSLMLNTGDDVLLHPGKNLSRDNELFISYPALCNDVKEGERILIDDGLIQLEVTDKTKKALKARVIEGGVLKSRKGVNFPHSKTTLSAFTEKDKRDLEFGIKIGIDYAALSFVRTAEDIDIVLRWAKKKGFKLPPLIAKIEKPEAVNNISDILGVADAIMVARGDLGVEMPTEKVPIIQKMLIDLANNKGKLVITATQMLESMTEHLRPTRAEASDVANAVLDGTDALMLSAETTTGRYPVDALKMMDRIIRFTEEAVGATGGASRRLAPTYEIGNTFPESIADGACRTAHNIGAKAIVVFTHSGFTAKLISKLRPQIPVIAFTTDERVLRTLPLYWGAIPKLISPKLIRQRASEILASEFVAEIEKSLLKDRLLRKGESIVFVASSPFLGKPNIIRLHTI